MSEKRGCFLTFEWKKTKFTSFGLPWKNFEKITWCPNLEKILPTRMAGLEVNLADPTWEPLCAVTVAMLPWFAHAVATNSFDRNRLPWRNPRFCSTRD